MLQTYIDYFKQKAEEHPDLKAFHLGSPEELFEGKLAMEPDAPLLYLEVYSVLGSEWDRDHCVNTYEGAFVIFGRVPDHELSETEMAGALSFSESIAQSIIASMKDDREKYHPLMNGLKGGFEMDRTRRMFDGLVGWRVGFGFTGT